MEIRIVSKETIKPSLPTQSHLKPTNSASLIGRCLSKYQSSPHTLG